MPAAHESSRSTADTRAALGCRVRSGRAVAAVMGAQDERPLLLDCRVLALSDPKEPASTQPYHAALVDHRLQQMAAAAPLIAIVKRSARRSVAALLAECRGHAWHISKATLVVGSLVDPATIANQHMRAHALEGQLFRTALADALEEANVRCSFLLERNAYDESAQRLKCPVGTLQKTIGDLGRARGGPWRADEKLAALAAWATLNAREL